MLEPLGKAIDISPGNSAYNSNLAKAYVFMRRIATARIVVEKAIELDPKNYNAYYVRGMANFWDSKFDEAKADATRAIEIDDTFAAGYVLVSDVYIAELSNKLTAGSSIKAEIGLLNAAADILKVGKEKREGKPSDALFDAAYESTIAFYEYISKNTAIISDAKDLPDPNVTPLKFISKPRPGYTDSAREANVQGTVILAVLFGADGEVQNVLVLRKLGSGLDQQAVAAVKKIQFKPMKRDGKPVSVVRTLQYTFSIY